MDLGLAPRPLGFGAVSVWGGRHDGLGLAPRSFGIVGTIPMIELDRSHCLCNCACGPVGLWSAPARHAKSHRPSPEI